MKRYRSEENEFPPEDDRRPPAPGRKQKAAPRHADNPGGSIGKDTVMKIQELYTIINAKVRGDGLPYSEEKFVEDISILQLRGVVVLDAAGDVRPRQKMEGRP